MEPDIDSTGASVAKVLDRKRVSMSVGCTPGDRRRYVCGFGDLSIFGQAFMQPSLLRSVPKRSLQQTRPPGRSVEFTLPLQGMKVAFVEDVGESEGGSDTALDLVNYKKKRKVVRYGCIFPRKVTSHPDRLDISARQMN